MKTINNFMTFVVTIILSNLKQIFYKTLRKIYISDTWSISMVEYPASLSWKRKTDRFSTYHTSGN